MITIVIAACNASFEGLDVFRRFQHWRRERHLFVTQRTKFQNSPWHPLFKSIIESALDGLRDLQLVTGTAILTATFPQWHTIPFYHQDLVVCYWFLTLTSLRAAQASCAVAIEVDEPRSLYQIILAYVRNILAVLSFVLAAIWNVHHLVVVQSHWDPCGSGKCYRARNKYTFPSQRFWTAGELLNACVLIVEWTSPGQRSLRKSRKWLQGCCEYLASLWIDEEQRWRLDKLNMNKRLSLTHVTAPAGFLVVRLVRLLILTTSLVLVWSFVQFLAVWSMGNGSKPMQSILYATFALWSIIVIFDLKSSNKPLLIGSETSWGFGQVLPLFLLVLLGFGFLDAAIEAYTKHERS